MKKGIDHIGIFASAIMHDGKGNILYRRRGPGARDEIGKWDIGAGGSLEFGETIEECLERELKEEVGVEILEKEYLGMRQVFRNLDGKDTHWLGFYYKCLIDPSKARISEDEECDAMEWAAFNDPRSPRMIGQEEVYEMFKHTF